MEGEEETSDPATDSCVEERTGELVDKEGEEEEAPGQILSSDSFVMEGTVGEKNEDTASSSSFPFTALLSLPSSLSCCSSSIFLLSRGMLLKLSVMEEVSSKLVVGVEVEDETASPPVSSLD